MSYMIEQYRTLFDKAYNEGLNANKYNNIPLAHRKFTEAMQYARKLASADPSQGEYYAARADKLSNILAAMKQAMNTAPKPIYTPTPGGSGTYTPGGSYGLGATSFDPTIESDEEGFYTFYSADSLKVGFDDVIGLNEAKDAVTEYVINPIKHPEAYNYNFLGNKCILLEGPPGTGKTTFAKAVARELGQPFAMVNTAALVNAYVGKTAQNIDKVFNALREYVRVNNCGLTVFFDEFDEVAKSRDGDDKVSLAAVPALLRNLDGMQDNSKFLIMANTNCKDMLDKGIQDRFRRKIHIPLPDLDTRKRLFRDKLGKTLEPEYFNQLDFDALARASEGRSGRSITQVCDDFLYFMGAVKSGSKSCESFTDALLQILERN